MEISDSLARSDLPWDFEIAPKPKESNLKGTKCDQV